MRVSSELCIYSLDRHTHPKATYQKSWLISDFTIQLHVKVVFVTGSQSSQTTLSQLSIWFLTSQNYSKHFPLFRILLNYFLLEYKDIKHEWVILTTLLIWAATHTFSTFTKLLSCSHSAGFEDIILKILRVEIKADSFFISNLQPEVFVMIYA